MSSTRNLRSRGRSILAAAVGTAVVAACGADPTGVGPPASAAGVTVHGDRGRQTMRGFGSSQRLFSDPHVIGGSVTDENPANGLQIGTADQDDVLDRLYGDLRLTRLRPGIFPVSLEPVNDNGNPAVTDLSKFDFTWKRNDGFFPLVSRARQRGLVTWWLSPGNLEPWMTESNPEEYVEWALTVLERWRQNGLELPYYSIMNEPGFSRGGIWSGEYIRDVVRLLGPAIEARGMSTRLVVPDDLNATEAARRAEVVLSDPGARPWVGAVAFHLYGEPRTRVQQMKDLRDRYGVELWMSEYFVSDAFEWARILHEMIALYDVSAVDHMWGFFGDSDASLVELRHQGTSFVGASRTKRFFTMAQYSRYVPPGARRVEVETTEPDLLVSAFRPGAGVTVVLINTGDGDREVSVQIDGVSVEGELVVVQTDDQRDLSLVARVTPSHGRFSVALTPRSVTTVTTLAP